MADRLAERVRAVLSEAMASTPAVRALLVELARTITAMAAEQDAAEAGGETRGEARAAAGDAAGARRQVDTPREVVSAARSSGEALQPARRVSLAIGGAVTEVEVPGSEAEIRAAEAALVRAPEGVRPEVRAEVDLGLIATRCRLKAESCLLYIERRAAEGDLEREPAVVDRMRRMIETGKGLRDCFLWVFWREAEQPNDARLREIAACYTALAGAAEVCAAATEPAGGLAPAEVERAFELLAEATSALRVALGWTWLTSPDRDQDDSYQWLRQETFARQVFVRRYMRLDDPAEPGRAAGLIADAASLVLLAKQRREDEKKIEALLKRVRYHAKRLPASGAGPAHDCERINEALEELARLGLRATDRRVVALREAVATSAFPAEVVPHAFLVTAAAVAGDAGDEGEIDEAAETVWSERVLRARGLLRGGSLVMIGGEPRPEAVARIARAFELSGVEWVRLTEHGTGAPMRAPIARESTRAVLVLIRLTGHLHAEEARRIAREEGKPCVQLPAGYNPEQIAEQVLTQVGEQLSRASA